MCSGLAGMPCSILACLVLVRCAWAGGLTSLPPDIADQAQTAAWFYAWAATHERMGPQGDVVQNKLDAQDAIDEMKKLAKGLMTESLVDEFQRLALFAGWNAANERAGDIWSDAGLLRDAETDREIMDATHQDMLNAGVLDDSLIWSLHWMSFWGSWYAANSRVGYDDDAQTDKAYYEHYAKLMRGEVTLLSIDFDASRGTMATQKPDVVGEQTLNNLQGEMTESMTFSYSYTQGHTDSYSNALGFKVGVAEKIKAGFLFVGEETTVSFEHSYTETWTSGSSDGTTKSYSFPLSVPAHKIYRARATVQQAMMDVPYTMKISIGDFQWEISGIWHGVAVSTAAYEIADVTPNSNAAVVLEGSLLDVAPNSTAVVALEGSLLDRTLLLV